MTSTIGHDRSRAERHSESTPLHELAARVGIVPEYFDLEGNLQRASDETRRAVLAAMGIDASSDELAQDALDQMLTQERDELIPPVRVVAQSSPERHAFHVHIPSGAG